MSPGDVGREAARLGGGEGAGEEGDGRGDLLAPRDDPVEPRRVGIVAAALAAPEGGARVALPPRNLLLQIGDRDLKVNYTFTHYTQFLPI